MNTDLKLNFDEDTKSYDIGFASDGDFEMSDGLEAAVLMSIYGEVRANGSEVVKAIFRRGDWSNELNDVVDYEVGSKFWLLEMARADQNSLNVGIDSIELGLAWLFEDNIVNDINVTGEIGNNQLTFFVEITQKNDEINTYRFEAYEATGAA